MSGKPSPERIQMFRMALSRMDLAGMRCSELRAEIAAKNVELDLQQGEYRSARESMFKLMEEMDVAGSGNAGWNDRIEWFFRELHRQFTRWGAKEPG